MIGNNIRKLRKSQKMTLQQLAALTDYDAGNLSRIERGELGVSEAMLRKIAQALSTTPAQLFEEGNGQVPPTQKPQSPQAFVNWFRSASPYIHAFRDKTFVVAFGGEVVSEHQFIALSHDLNLLSSLGVNLVLVHGVRPQVEKRLIRDNLKPKYHNGLRITDDVAMEMVKEANGAVRVQIEALLSMGVANSPMAGADIRVASGNFVTSKPIGVIDGVDLQHTGEVRKIDHVGIQKRLDDDEMVLLSPMGYSPTGEAFNLTLEDVAVNAAIALDAEKLIFLMNEVGVHNLRGELLREMTVSKASNLLAQANQSDVPKYFGEDVALYLQSAVKACEQGVARAHLISRYVDGAILQELFTVGGVGTMVTEQGLESMRQATVEDVGSILKLIEPLESQGVLVRRGREQLEMEVSAFYVMEHDGRVIGCAALYPFATDSKVAEFACLAIDPVYRGAKRGDRLFDYCVSVAKSQGVKQLFCLTTRTEHWFIERGFVEKNIDALPAEKKQLYNYQRNSKVFMKSL